VEHPTYDDGVIAQMDEVTVQKGQGDLNALFRAGDTWEVEAQNT